MALSLDSIYAPLNDFFLKRFQADGNSPVLFRFDKLGSMISNQDFMDPNHPELGYSPGVAIEKFSDLVNHVPVANPDGLNIFLSQAAIDDMYFFRLVSPAVALVPEGADTATTDSVVNSFNAIKADAQKLWANIRAESSSGLMLEYKPSMATPVNWYDVTKNELWTDQSFTVSEPAAPTVPAPQYNLWRLKLSDTAMQDVLQANEARMSAPVFRKLSAVQPRLDTPVLAPRMVQRTMAAGLGQPISRAAFTTVNLTTPTVIAGVAAAPPSFALHANYVQQVSTLSVADRLAIGQIVVNSAPVQPAKTNSITVYFSYCIVNIRRPWFMDTFMSDKSWFIPSAKKGDLTSGAGDGTLPLMPVGFVAIKNLSIQADWPAEDLASANSATDFGPFKVDSAIVDSKLSHQGIQIVGWLLQKMPDLPPNEPPVSTAPAN
jgi:hypothetical protein